MSLDFPTISVIIPLYNKEESIVSTIDSVLTQNYSQFELIIINDGSTDSSIKKVLDIKDSRIRIINQENKGISGARNSGIYAATGKWILFLDADDTLLPNALSTLAQNIIDDLTIVAANFLINRNGINTRMLPSKKQKLYSSKNEIYKAWALKRLFLRTGSFIIPSDIAKNKLYNESFNRFEDLDFLFRCFNHLRVFYIPDSVMVYETSFAQASKSDSKKWEKDFLFYLPFDRDCFWKNCVLGGFMRIAINSYPTKKDYLLIQYSKYNKYLKYSRMINYYSILRYGFFLRCLKN